jgi:hypothetical protein
MCLIKLYRGRHDKAQTCYWVPTNTKASLLSLLIRYWRWSESDFLADPVTSSQLEAWTPLTESEDFLERFWVLNTSTPLGDVIRKHALEGWLENEPIFEKPHSQHSKNSMV